MQSRCRNKVWKHALTNQDITALINDTYLNCRTHEPASPRSCACAWPFPTVYMREYPTHNSLYPFGHWGGMMSWLCLTMYHPSATPSRPGGPRRPSFPGGPGSPFAPLTPTNPSGPGSPWRPGKPCCPMSPSKPASPIRPGLPMRQQSVSIYLESKGCVANN